MSKLRFNLALHNNRFSIRKIQRFRNFKNLKGIHHISLLSLITYTPIIKNRWEGLNTLIKSFQVRELLGVVKRDQVSTVGGTVGASGIRLLYCESELVTRGVAWSLHP